MLKCQVNAVFWGYVTDLTIEVGFEAPLHDRGNGDCGASAVSEFLGSVNGSSSRGVTFVGTAAGRADQKEVGQSVRGVYKCAVVNKDPLMGAFVLGRTCPVPPACQTFPALGRKVGGTAGRLTERRSHRDHGMGPVGELVGIGQRSSYEGLIW